MNVLKLLLLFLCVSTTMGQNSLHIKDLNAGPGEVTRLVIGLENQDNVSGLQFTLKLPKELIVREKETKFIERHTNHVIYPKRKGNGNYLFLTFSGSNDNFTGKTGDLIEIPIEIPLSYVAGQTYDLELTEVIVSSASGENIGSAHENGVLTIVEGKNPDLKTNSVDFSITDILPENTFALQWTVENIGEVAAIGGWTEQVYLVSQTTAKKYLLGNFKYTDQLEVHQTIQREGQLKMPSIIGFDGKVKLQVVVIPSTTVKEPESFKANNTAVSTREANLLNKLKFEIDKTKIIKNSNDEIRIHLSRSGAVNEKEEFTVTSNDDSAFELPLKIILDKDQSSNFAYLKLKPSVEYKGDSDIELKVTSNAYPEEKVSFTLIEDKKNSLSLTFPTDYSSKIGDKISFTLTAAFKSNKDQTLSISSDNASRLHLPTEIVLKAGENTATFEGVIRDPGIVSRKIKANLFVKAVGYLPATAAVQLNSVNIPKFTMILSPDVISEGDGVKATYVTLKRTSHINKEVFVELASSPKNQLILPEGLLFEENQTEKTFNVGIIDNAIAEGDRKLTIFSKIRFTDCLCTDDTDSLTISQTDVNVIDNDGLALTLSVSPSTMKAGSVANTLKIGRNTTDPSILKDPVQVQLTSTLPSVVNLPASVIIPADTQDITLTFDTKINADLKGDQTGRIEAKAEQYEAGFAWVLITDQNKPDVIISKVTAPKQVEAGNKVEISANIVNQGHATFGSGSKIDYFLSSTNSTNGLTPFSSSILTKEINPGGTYNFSEEIQLPTLSGKLNLIVVINADNAISELSLTNNQNLQAVEFLPAYLVTLSLDKTIYKPSEKIQISGVAKKSNGVVVPMTDVEITIMNKGFSRNFITKTNANGAFLYEFVPLDNESGNYSVKAAYPGATVAPQATFDILGFEIVNKPQYVKWEPYVDIPLGKEFVLKNNTSVRLTGVKIILPDNADFELEQTPITIEAGQQVALGFKLTSINATLENKYTDINISIVSNEGAELKENVYYFSKYKDATLRAEPISVNTTMAKDSKRLYELVVRNTGDVDAKEVEVRLPNLDWLKLKSPKIIDKIEAGKEAKIVLELAPTVKEQINVPISGNFVLKGKNSKALSIPFRIETVSEAIGKLVVDATDEYTYNTASGKHVAGAKVVVKHPFSGAIVAEGITNDAGLFEVPSLNEGYYTVTVHAEKHNPYQNNIMVDPGKTTVVEAFMQYQAVSYTWEVVPTEVEDEYDVKLITEFETNVPKPVVVMELDNSKLDLEDGESRMLNLTITNYGLIAAYRVTINAPDIEGYEINPLIKSMETLNAKTTVVVPVLLKKLVGNNRGINKEDNTGKKECISGAITLEGYFFCNAEEKLYSFTSLGSTHGCSAPKYTIEINSPECPLGCSGGGFDLKPGGSQSSVISFPSICDPCTKSILTLGITCAPQLKAVRCALGFLTAKDMLDVALAASGCVTGPKKCWQKIVLSLAKCFSTFGSGEKNRSLELANEPSKNNWDYIREDFEKLIATNDAQDNKILEYLNNNTELAANREELLLFIKEVGSHLDDEKPFTPAAIENIISNLKNTSISATYINDFAVRWNTSLEAWNKNIFSPNAQYPNIVDKTKIEAYNVVINDLTTYALSRGFVSLAEMYDNDIKALEDFSNDAMEQKSSVCATVTIEFPQKLTMTREAFEGTLTINNSSNKNIKDINLDLIITDEFGDDKTNLFQINKDAFLNGTGLVGPDSKGKGVAIFIPTKAAAPELKTSYSFGGVLSYFDEDINERVNITLNSVTLEVNPSPDLVLHYFMQRDIIGDDALTEDVVEASIPAELSLMIKNEGYGEAKNVKVESAQPKIIDNDKGLAIDFNIIGSNFNNEPKQLGLLEVDFGNIAAQKSAVGQWFFTSSLLGHFVKYKVEVNHTSSFGNKELSLIKASYVHELIKSVRAYQPGSDQIADFLVNDIADAYDTPDRIYMSDGTSEEVVIADEVTNSIIISGSNLNTKITIKPSTSAWNYGNLPDPGNGNFKLVKVVRDSDQVEIPLDNFWQTSVTLKNGLNPKYENKLHVLDKITAIETYTLSYVSRDENTPIILAIEGTPPNESSASPIEFVQVKFNKEIDVNTFNTNNIKLVHQGVTLPDTDVMIGKIDETTYAVNIKALTKLSGFYELTVSSVGIKDLVGNEGHNAKRATWLQFLNELGVLKFESDQIKKQPINTVTLIFNKVIRTEEFTADKIAINDVPASNVTVQQLDDFTYSITGLAAFNQEGGTYNLSIDLPGITAVDGSKGLAKQSFDWTVDKDLPKIVLLEPLKQGGVNEQHITEIDIHLNKKISEKPDASSFVFYRNGQRFNAPLTIQKLDELSYKVSGFADYVKDNGTYLVRIDQSSLKDEHENLGEGFAEVSWTVKLSALEGLGNVRIAPDRGVSNSDHVTSGDDVQLFYKTLEDQLAVEVYELFATSQVLLHKSVRDKAGEYSVSLKDQVGAKRFKVIATDGNGNKSTPQIVSTFIDFTNISTKIEAIKESNESCYDFDYVKVTFSEEIDAKTFTKNAITLKSSGISITKKPVVITRVNDKEFLLEHISHNEDGAITLEIDKSKISKKLSGMFGSQIDTQEIGVSNKYTVTVSGEEPVQLDKIITYTATASMNKYDWLIINGEIISTSANTVTVKWNTLGEQTLILRYQTPMGCTSTFTKNVLVKDEPLGIDPAEISENHLKLFPVPNNGIFTIHTSEIISEGSLSIYNLSGQLLHKETNADFKNSIKEVNVSHLPAGVYILQISHVTGTTILRFVIQ